jgi:DNA-binding CsgD family transcriptional regulator
LQFPLAFSPIEYFILNVIFIFAALQYFLREENVKVDSPAKLDISLVEDFNDFTKEFNISQREMEIIQGILQGRNNLEIGEQLFISPNTVKNHIYNIFKKLSVKTRYELINRVMFYQRDRSAFKN